jgi:hypothetical protein
MGAALDLILEEALHEDGVKEGPELWRWAAGSATAPRVTVCLEFYTGHQSSHYADVCVLSRILLRHCVIGWYRTIFKY